MRGRFGMEYYQDDREERLEMVQDMLKEGYRKDLIKKMARVSEEEVMLIQETMMLDE